MEPTRREFIQNGLTFLSLGMAAPAILARAAAQSAAPGQTTTGKILVVLQLSGGNDGLNTVIPYTDDLYYRNRPTIGVHHSDVVQISDKIGLNPGLASLKTLYDKGQVAIIQGAGYPNPNRSHFRSMEIWQTAEPTSTIVGEGWLGRYFDEDGHLRANPLMGINFGGELPRTLYSDFGSVVSMQSPESFQLQPIIRQEREAELQAFTALYEHGTMAHSYADLIRKVGQEAYTSSNRIKQALAAKPGDGAALGAPAGTSLDAPPAYPKAKGAARATPLGNNLHTVARIIGADLGTRIFYISTGGFDTHSNQPRTQQALLQDLADSLVAFTEELEQMGRAKDVAIMVFSEFGRRVQENASAGTDHGAAGPMFVLGGGIKGGLYGQYPALDDLAQGDLKFNVDFRQVYATLLDKWLGMPSEKVLHAHFDALPFLG